MGRRCISLYYDDEKEDSIFRAMDSLGNAMQDCARALVEIERDKTSEALGRVAELEKEVEEAWEQADGG